MLRKSKNSLGSSPDRNERLERLTRCAEEDAIDRLGEILSLGQGYELSESALTETLRLVEFHALLLEEKVPLCIFPGEDGGTSIVIHNVSTKRRLEIDVPREGVPLATCFVNELNQIAKADFDEAWQIAPLLMSLLEPKSTEVPTGKKSKSISCTQLAA